MNSHNPWQPTRRRLTDSLSAAIAPVAAFSLALGGLTTWVTVGKAGSPARIAVSNGRVFLPYGNSTDTAAFFDVTNLGGAQGRLVGVTTPAARDGAQLTRHRMTGSAAATRQNVASVTIRAGDQLSMSPQSLDVTLQLRKRWRPGDLVPFTLQFEHGAPIRTLAVVIRPGGSAS